MADEWGYNSMTEYLLDCHEDEYDRCNGAETNNYINSLRDRGGQNILSLKDAQKDLDDIYNGREPRYSKQVLERAKRLVRLLHYDDVNEEFILELMGHATISLLLDDGKDMLKKSKIECSDYKKGGE